MTSQQVCEGSTGKLSPQGLDGLPAPQRRVERKKGGTKASRQRTRSLRARLEALVKKEGEGVQGGQGLPSKRESGLEEVWTSRMRPRVARSWINKRRSSRRSCEILKSSRVSQKNFREALRETCSSSFRKWKPRRHDQGAEKIAKETASTTKEEICRKTVPQQQRRCGSFERSSSKKEERVPFLSNKIDKNKMQDAEMAAELRNLQAGEERRGSNASQTGDGCLEAMWQ